MVDIRKQRKKVAQQQAEKNNTPSISEQNKEKLKQQYEKKKSLLSDASKIIAEYGSIVGIEKIYSDLGLEIDVDSNNGEGYSFNLGDKLFVCDLITLNGKSEIESKTRISPLNPRRGKLSQRAIGSEFWNKIVFTKGNAQPGFANQPSEGIKFEILDSQRRRYVCMEEDLTYKFYASRTMMTTDEAQELTDILQFQHKSLSLFQMADEFKIRFQDSNYTNFTQMANNTSLIPKSGVFKHSSLLYLKLGSKLVLDEGITSLLDEDIHSYSKSQLSLLVNAFKPIEEYLLKDENYKIATKEYTSKQKLHSYKDEYNQSINSFNESLQGEEKEKAIQQAESKRLEAIISLHESTVQHYKYLNNCFGDVWMEVRRGVIADLESSTEKGVKFDIKTLANTLKLALSKALNNQVKKKTKPKPVNIEMSEGSKGEATLLEHGTSKAPQLTLKLKSHGPNEVTKIKTLIEKAVGNKELLDKMLKLAE